MAGNPACGSEWIRATHGPEERQGLAAQLLVVMCPVVLSAFACFVPIGRSVSQSLLARQFAIKAATHLSFIQALGARGPLKGCGEIPLLACAWVRGRLRTVAHLSFGWGSFHIKCPLLALPGLVAMSALVDLLDLLVLLVLHGFAQVCSIFLGLPGVRVRAHSGSCLCHGSSGLCQSSG